MNAKIYISLAIISAIAIFYFSDSYISSHKTPTLDSIRASVVEAERREEKARRDREISEDTLLQALDTECRDRSLMLTGARYAEKKQKAHECYKIESSKENTGSIIWTASLTPISEVPIRKLIPSPNASISSSIRPDIRTAPVHSELYPTKKGDNESMGTVAKANTWHILAQASNGKWETRPKGSSKEICPSKIILRKWWNDPRVQYGYKISCGDMDFIKTIEAESKWDISASGDSHKSYWLCQINKIYNPQMQKDYRALKTDNEKVTFCYGQYSNWVSRGVIKTRLYGYNVRNLPQNNSFTFK